MAEVTEMDSLLKRRLDLEQAHQKEQTRLTELVGRPGISPSTRFSLINLTKVQVLVLRAILAPGKRTVTSALRVVGMADEPGFSKYHQVLNRAACSSHWASHILLDLLLEILSTGLRPIGLWH